jgi:hypothetical protein
VELNSVSLFCHSHEYSGCRYPLTAILKSRDESSQVICFLFVDSETCSVQNVSTKVECTSLRKNHDCSTRCPNFALEWLAFLRRSREILGSDIGPDVSSPDVFIAVSPNISKQIPGYYRKLSRDRFF